MNIKKNLEIKYLTGYYSLVEEDPSITGIIISLTNAVKKSRKSKKMWYADDFVINDSIIESVYGDKYSDIKSKLIEDGAIHESDGNYTIDKKKLYEIFDF